MHGLPRSTLIQQVNSVYTLQTVNNFNRSNSTSSRVILLHSIQLCFRPTPNKKTLPAFPSALDWSHIDSIRIPYGPHMGPIWAKCRHTGRDISFPKRWNPYHAVDLKGLLIYKLYLLVVSSWRNPSTQLRISRVHSQNRHSHGVLERRIYVETERNIANLVFKITMFRLSYN